MKYPAILFVSSTIDYGNMSQRRGNPEEALNNKVHFLKKLQVNPENVITMSPTHTNNIKIVTKKDASKTIAETDGIITTDSDLTLFTLTGDCIPLALVDKTKNVFGLFHLSWKNLNHNFVEEIINLFKKFSTDPKNLTAHFGPSIGPCCYTPSGATQLNDLKWQPFIQKKAEETYSIDIWRFAENELIKNGIPKQSIDNPRICTYHTGKYFSHRKTVKENLENDYRFGTALTLK